MSGDERIKDESVADNKILTAKYFLSLEAAHKVSRSAVDEIVSSTSQFMSHIGTKLHKRINSIPGIEPFKESIDTIFQENSKRTGLDQLATG